MDLRLGEQPLGGGVLILGVVEVELLVVDGCANAAAARLLVDEAARVAGLTGIRVSVTTIATDEEAQRRGFLGSPTFLVNGVDAFPARGATPGLSCRLYRTRSGLSGVPELEQLRQALLAG